MALETATYIDGLDAANPAASDAISTADDHLRLIKATLLATFPNIDGPVTVDQDDINGFAPLASPVLTGTPEAPTAAPGTDTDQIATTAFVQAVTEAERDATVALTNKTISADSNTISGIAASSFVLSNSSGNIDGSAAQKAIPSGTVVGTSDTQTLTNKTVALGSNTVSGTKSEFNTAVTDTDFAFLNDFTGSNQSLATSGYQKLPGGLIIQWGSADTASGSGGSYTVTWPTAFTTACVAVTANITNSGSLRGIFVTAKSTTSGTFYTRNNTDSINAPFNWVAIGY